MLLTIFTYAVTCMSLQGTPALQEIQGSYADYTQFGHALSPIGDLNGDSVGDLVVGAPYYHSNGLSYNGAAFVVSGADGSIIFQFDGTTYMSYFGNAVAAIDDTNGDGLPDILVSAPENDSQSRTDNGSVYLYSGLDGTLLRQWHGTSYGSEFGRAIAVGGDIDADGVSDILISSHQGTTPYGVVYCYSGSTGSLLRQWSISTSYGPQFGTSVSFVNDIDGDGKDDVVIGHESAVVNGLVLVGAVFCFSGGTGAQLYQWEGTSAKDYFGSDLSTTGDINNDGYNDILIGSYSASVAYSQNQGAVFAYSGADGSLIRVWYGANIDDELGKAVAIVGDLNNDGCDDIVASDPWRTHNGISSCGVVYAYSGLDGALLYRWAGTDQYANLGISLVGAGDINGDNVPDIWMGAQGAATAIHADGGLAIAYSGAPAAPTYTITNLVSNSIGTFAVSDVPPNSTVTIGYSLAGAGPISTAYGIVYMTPPVSVLSVLNSDANGDASISLSIPPSASGYTLYTQALAGNLLSNSLAEVIL